MLSNCMGCPKSLFFASSRGPQKACAAEVDESPVLSFSTLPNTDYAAGFVHRVNDRGRVFNFTVEG